MELQGKYFLSCVVASAVLFPVVEGLRFARLSSASILAGSLFIFGLIYLVLQFFVFRNEELRKILRSYKI
jgi:hypothetical protein